MTSRKNFIRISFLSIWLAVTGIVPHHFAYAAWTRDQGDLFVAQTLSLYSTQHFIDDNGASISQPEFRKREWNGYGEYGWRDDLTLGANVFFHQLEADSPVGTAINYGIADPEFFIRKRLWHNEQTVISIQPLIKLPSFYHNPGNPRGGTDDMDGEIRLQGGYGFDYFSRHHYVTTDVGYRKRLGEWGDQLKLDATAGLSLTDSVTLMPQLFLTKRIGDANVGSFTSATVNDYDLLKGQLSVVWQATPSMAFQLGAFSHLYARHTGDGGGVIAGLWYHF